MESLFINRKSWHYRLASYYATTCDRELTDICAYTRKVLIGAFFALLLTAIGGALAGTLGCFLAWLLSWLVTGFLILLPTGAIPATILLFAVSVGFTFAGFKWGFNKLAGLMSRGTKVAKQPGFLKLSYRSFKDKYCIKVSFDK